MKIMLLNGSPKKEGSASGIILASLRERIGKTHECFLCHAARQDKQEIMRVLCGANAMVVAFPLYVDGIPSHLLRLLDEMWHEIADAAPSLRVYAIVNNGFYEGRQNITALEMMRNFCDRAGLVWGQGVAVGAGGMTGAASIGHGPMKNLGLALDRLSKHILNGETSEDNVFEPNFPRFLYKAAAHMGWKSQARKNGLKTDILYKSQGDSAIVETIQKRE